MISCLRGILIEKQPPFLWIEIGEALTYEIQAAMSTFYQLPAVGEKVQLHTHFLVREDGHYLFGFYTLAERTLFRELLKVNGIGPKVALAILSQLEPRRFIECVSTQDSTSLQRIPGIGKKTAERLMIEMRDRLLRLNKDINFSSQLPKIPRVNTNQDQDAIEALMSLGYKLHEATRAIHPFRDQNLVVEELIRCALKSMD